MDVGQGEVHGHFSYRSRKCLVSQTCGNIWSCVQASTCTCPQLLAAKSQSTPRPGQRCGGWGGSQPFPAEDVIHALLWALRVPSLSVDFTLHQGWITTVAICHGYPNLSFWRCRHDAKQYLIERRTESLQWSRVCVVTQELSLRGEKKTTLKTSKNQDSYRKEALKNRPRRKDWDLLTPNVFSAA